MTPVSLTDTLLETLAVFEGGGEPLTTPEVADRLDLGRRSTYNRLDRLAETGRIQTKKVGANARVWWQPLSGDTAEKSNCPAAAESLIDDVLHNAEVGLFVLDENFDVAWINAATERYFGLDGERILGRDKYQIVEDHILPVLDDSETFAETVLSAYDDRSCTEQFVCHVTAGDGREERWLEHRSKPIESGAYAGGKVELYYDVTEQEERERELSQYETLFEESRDVSAIIESDSTFRYLTTTAENVLGYEPEELVGEVGLEYVHPDDRETVSAELEKMIETPGYEPRTDFRFKHGDGSWITLEALARDFRGDPDIEGIVVYTRDVTERREREQELERYAGIIDAVDEPVYELDNRGRFTFVNDAFLEQSGYDEDELLGEHISMGMDDIAIARAEAQIADLLADDTKENTSLEYEVVTKEGDRIPVENRISLLTDDDGQVYGSAGVLWDITEQVERRRELERQREQLAALDNLNDVVRDITDAVLNQSMREEIESAVCERLAESDSYEFAWIAEVDPQTLTLEPRVEAGVEGYLEAVSISMDPDESSGQGPGGRAFRTRTIQTTQDVLTDTAFEPWHEIAEKYGYRSVAAIPIVHGEAFYGLLAVYADRPRAFEDEEQEVIGQLGEVVGHAIAAVERKRALTSDEISEIEFSIPGISDLVGIDGSIDGAIRFDRAVPTGDGDYLEYGTVDVEAIESLEALTDRLPHSKEVRLISRGTDTARFELRLSEPPVVSIVASHGGYLERAAIEDDEYHLRIHLPVTVEARRVIDAVRDAYPNAELVRRRQITRSEDQIVRINQVLASELTERQRSTLEAAYHSGFFEWPRDATGQEIADSLGVAPSTFAYHLRKGQQEVFESLFSKRSAAD